MPPNIQQGTLNRLKVSVILATFPQLNITPPFLGKQMVQLNFDGKITEYVPTTTGAVTSPQPYRKVTITAHLLKTQSLAPAYKAQYESSSLLGDVTVWPDVQTGQGIGNYQFFNCSIEDVRELNFDGADAGWAVQIGGYELINNALWN